MKLKLDCEISYITKLYKNLMTATQLRCRLCKSLFTNKQFLLHHKYCWKSTKQKIAVLSLADDIIHSIKGFDVDRKTVRIAVRLNDIASSHVELYRKKSVADIDDHCDLYDIENADEMREYQRVSVELTALSSSFKFYIKELKMDSQRAIHDNLIRRRIRSLLPSMNIKHLTKIREKLTSLQLLIGKRLLQVSRLVSRAKLDTLLSLKKLHIQRKKSMNQDNNTFRSRVLRDLKARLDTYVDYDEKTNSLEMSDKMLRASLNSEQSSQLSFVSEKSESSGGSIVSPQTAGFKQLAGNERGRLPMISENDKNIFSERKIDAGLRSGSWNKQKKCREADPRSVSSHHNTPLSRFAASRTNNMSVAKLNPQKLKTDQIVKFKSKLVYLTLTNLNERLTISDQGEYFKNDDTLIGKVSRVSMSDFSYIRVLGKGAFGTVYLVEHKATKDLFALKIISKTSSMTVSDINNLLTERNIFGIVEGEFVTQAISSFIYKGLVCFLMEFMPGGDLRNLLDKEEYFDEEWAKFYLAEIVLGLESLHKKGICHRDLKPENILVDSNGHIKLTDFALAKIGIKQSHSFCGTKCYSPPELIIQKGYDHTVDYWALGCLVFEMMVGRPPFYHSNEKILYNIILTENYQRDLIEDDIAADFISKLLEKNPSNRLGSKGIQEITSHAFFSSIDFEKLSNHEVESPLKDFIVERKPETMINQQTNIKRTISNRESLNRSSNSSAIGSVTSNSTSQINLADAIFKLTGPDMMRPSRRHSKGRLEHLDDQCRE